MATLAQRLDVTDQDAIVAAFDVVRKRLGVPRVLLTAAGIEINDDSVNVTAEQWRKVIDVNLAGTFFAAQAFGSALLQAGLPGSAILISSMSGVHRERAAVGGVVQRVEGGGRPPRKVPGGGVGTRGIRVNSVAPGYVLTDLTERIIDQHPSLRDEWIARIPLGRIATPDDLSGLVSFLASDASSYLTAQTSSLTAATQRFRR